MKVLIDPIYTSANINSCSTYIRLKRLVKFLLEKREDIFFYFCLPNDHEKFNIEDPLPDDRIKYFYTAATEERYKHYYDLDDEFVHKFLYNGAHNDWDILLTNRSPLVALQKLQSEFQATRDEFRKHFYIIESYPLFGFKKTTNKIHIENVERQILASYLASDRVYSFAEFERNGIIRAAKNYLAPSQVMHLQEKIKLAINFWVEEFKDTRPVKGERKRIIYVQRLSKVQRRTDLVLKAFEYTRTLHHGRYEYEVYTISEGVEQYKKQYPFVEFFNLTRDEYMRKLQSSHAFLCMSVEEAAPNGIIQAVMQGVLGVIYKAEWSVELFGDDYPFFVKGEKEAAAMLTYVIENYDKAYEDFRAWAGKMRDRMLATYRNLHDELWQEIEEYEVNKIPTGQMQTYALAFTPILAKLEPNTVIDVRKIEMEAVKLKLVGSPKIDAEFRKTETEKIGWQFYYHFFKRTLNDLGLKDCLEKYQFRLPESLQNVQNIASTISPSSV